MAPKGQKRNAPETKKVAAPKKARAITTDVGGTENPTLKAIEDAIELSDLPLNCRNMLVTGIRGCFNTPSEPLHEVHSLVLSMVEEVLGARETRLQEALEAAKAAEDAVLAAKAQLVTTLSETEAMLAEKTKIAEESCLATAAAAEKTAVAAALLSDKQALQCKGDAARVELQENKAAVARGIETASTALLGAVNCEDVLATLQKLTFDDSLIKALPATCARAPADRGPFDGMVLNQLETSLAQKLTELTDAIEAETPGAKERADAVDSAQAQVTHATTFQENATAEQATADACRIEASTAVEAAKTALAAQAPDECKAVANREQKTAALEDYQKNTQGPFNALHQDKKASTTIEVVCPDAKVTPVESEAAAPISVGGA